MAIATTDRKLVLNFTQDKTALKTALDQLAANARGKKPAYRDFGTLLAVLNEMFNETDARPTVIFQAYGGDFFLLKDGILKLPPEIQEWRRRNRDRFKESPYSFNDVLAAVEKSKATIYSIIPTLRIVGFSKEEQLQRTRTRTMERLQNVPGKPDAQRIAELAYSMQAGEASDQVAGQTAMMQIARLSGGYTEFIEQSADAHRIYETIFKVISNRYTIGYYTNNQTRDGKRRTVKVEVRDHPEYLIVGRKSYFLQ